VTEQQDPRRAGTTPARYGAHPFAEIFPMIGQRELQELAADIQENGLNNAIVLLEDKILDGRCRSAACALAGVEPRYVPYKPGKDPLRWVVSQNLHRRHLTDSQRAMVAARLANLRRGQNARHHRVGERDSSYEPSRSAPAAMTQKDAADALKVSRASVKRASNVIRQAETPGPEQDVARAISDAVDRGDLQVSVAADREFRRRASEIHVQMADPEDAVARAREERTQDTRRRRQFLDRYPGEDERPHAEVAILQVEEDLLTVEAAGAFMRTPAEYRQSVIDEALSRGLSLREVEEEREARRQEERVQAGYRVNLRHRRRRGEAMTEEELQILAEDDARRAEDKVRGEEDLRVRRERAEAERRRRQTGTEAPGPNEVAIALNDLINDAGKVMGMAEAAGLSEIATDVRDGQRSFKKARMKVHPEAQDVV